MYELYERLTTRFPEILFESCAGGGGRFDPGMLAFAPQAWTSDDTDAIERLRIQWGTSLVYPLSSMGAHVVGGAEPPDGRGSRRSRRGPRSRSSGSFGYELDPTALSDAERAEVADQIAFYQAHRELFQRGRFVRLRSPFEGDRNQTAWMSVAPDRRDRARRLVPGPQPALARAASAAAARPRPGGRLPRVACGRAATTPWRGPTRACGPARS